MTTILTSREFNQDTSRAKQAAQRGPVIITDRGRPAHVLLSIDAFRELSSRGQSIIDMISDPVAGAIDFEPPRLDFSVREAVFD